MRRAWISVAVVAALARSGAAQDGPAAAPSASPAPRAPDLRLTTLREGLRGSKADSPVRKAAAAVGLDLDRPPHPLVAHRFADAQVLYVFYKTTANAFGDRPYVVQRIRKTERSWKKGATDPETKVTYLVEAFKTLGRVIKGEDQHYGHFHLGDFERREVVKEHEIGFGEVPGVCEGPAWPFAVGTLYRALQPYQEEIDLHAKTVFRAMRPWTLTVSFGRGGTYRVASPELGFDLPAYALDPAIATPSADATSKDVVLERGVGTLGVTIGASSADDLAKRLGAPLEDVPAGRDHRLMSSRRSLTCNLDPAGRPKTVITRPGFAGTTKEGVAHGTTRAKVLEILGTATGAKPDAETWSYEGIAVTFDGFDRVSRIVLARRRD